MSDVPTPGFLIAMPSLVDPNFFRSVVLLVAHSGEGSFGLVLNHPLELSVQDVCDDAGIPWTGDDRIHAYAGGPVQRERGWLLHGDGEVYDGSQPIAGDLALSASQEALGAFGRAPEGPYRLMLGYAGWGPGQLEEEVRHGSWLTTPLDDPRVIFETPPGKLWATAMRTVGVDPTYLVDGSSVLN
ncbi:MAG: YqgE/AlgH family protein [Myxococcota bacterium]